MNFTESLQELMLLNNVDAKTLHQQTKIDLSTIYDYFKGTFPKIHNAILLANYFNCSLNYLFGLDFEPNSTSFSQEYNSNLFFERYTKLLKEQKISNHKLCKDTGVNESSYWLWSKGGLPKLEGMIKIAQYLNCSLDYLVGRNDTR
ncbi:MAG: helix-turn-helix transcriptional regulator [Clostridia bacterium]|nr:helix-turn-helix transcriptional regulator [Clostridia bacterium]